jgi:hypothetical protein
MDISAASTTKALEIHRQASSLAGQVIDPC